MSASTSSVSSGFGQAGSMRTDARRRLVRRLSGASPFMWRGALPLLGLAVTGAFALGPFASGDIEATVAHEVRHTLQARGMGWVNVGVSGQEVLLSGTPPQPGAGDAALALAREATCPTWAGPKVCAVTVVGAFALTGSPTLPAAPAGPAAPPATVAPAPVAASPAAAACEAAFARLLESSRIEFASGGAVVDARSARLLDELARTARGCPGRILVEGHTDNVGDPDANRRLSEARAAAVRDALLKRGVPATQLEALGYGETRPLADNGNEAGRTANRRIEFKALP